MGPKIALYFKTTGLLVTEDLLDLEHFDRCRSMCKCGATTFGRYSGATHSTHRGHASAATYVIV